MKILVTGASGFIGSRLCWTATRQGHSVRAIIRQNDVSRDQAAFDVVKVDDIGPQTDWSIALKDIEVIIHLAARVHVMKELSTNPLEQYRIVNVEGTRRLASIAVKTGVTRIVYVSTIKVNGESTDELPFSEVDIPSPQDPYALSKWEAEEALREISYRSGMEVVVIRPPLVYGPGVKGNMLRLMRYIYRGYPLPFGGIRNKRSLISLDNLVEMLILSAAQAKMTENTFLASDGEDLSTPELIEKIAMAMERTPKLITFPGKAFSIVGSIIPSIRPAVDRLTGSLVIDSRKFGKTFDWKPPQTPEDGIRAMVHHYLQNVS